MTQKSGIRKNGDRCTVGDYDNDGAPDLVLSGGSVVLLHNEKDGTFKDATFATGIKAQDVKGLAFLDYDHDGDLDLIVTRSNVWPSPTLVWRNNGNGTFTDTTDVTGFTQHAAMGG